MFTSLVVRGGALIVVENKTEVLGWGSPAILYKVATRNTHSQGAIKHLLI